VDILERRHLADGETRHADVEEGSSWGFVTGACWHAPAGPESSIVDKPHHPVVHISLIDALAYCEWTGMRMPTEVEWEFAARSGRDSQTTFAWGADLEPGGQRMANYWRGEFPSRPGDDNLGTTSPVGQFPPNEAGLIDMIGNVWEWTTTIFTDGHSVTSCCGAQEIEDPFQQGGELMVLKGGSHPAALPLLRFAHRLPRRCGCPSVKLFAGDRH
jgi:formylglycine-generating enzyme required for sulfatase activity